MSSLFSSGGSNSETPVALNSLRVQSSVMGRGLTVVFGRQRVAPNLLWGGDFASIAKTSSAGGKGGGGSQTTGYSYTASIILGICEGPVNSLGKVWLDKDISTLSELGFTAYLGTTPQAVWPFLTTNHPTEAINYPGICYVAAAPYNLTDAGTLQNHNFEVQGFRGFNVAGGIYDVDASLVVSDTITNTNWGLGLSAGLIGDLTQFSNYVVANGFFCSPVFDEQKAAQDYLDDIITSLNCMPYWSSGVLKVAPLGDTAITGNGKTYTPNLTPLYDLTDDDYIYSAGTDPVRCKRIDPADAINKVSWEFLDRSNDYNVAVSECQDQALIDQYGVRDTSKRTAHHICDAGIASDLAQLDLQRSGYVRNQYEVTVGYKFVVLEPSDLITLTDSGLGLSRQLVRVLEWSESDTKGAIDLVVEEMAVGTANAPRYGRQAGSGYVPNFNVSPGTINAPIIFDAPPELATTNGLEIWCAVSGSNVNWAGVNVWLSSDGTTYESVGTLHGRSRMGVTTTSLPAGSNPDTAHTLGVDLSSSLGALLSGTMADADAFHTACYVDGEVISYQTATLTAANKYDLTYMRRGGYNTPNAAHLSGAPFCRLDETLFKFPYSKDQIGSTVYVKFTSFNGYGGGEENLASVTAYPHVITGPTPPLQVQNFSVVQNGDVVAATWDDLGDYALVGYDIGYAPVGSTVWDQFTPLTVKHRGTEMTNASVPPGTWVFGIVGHDIADQISTAISMTTVTISLTTQAILSQAAEAPAFTGTLANMVRHYTGVVAPENQFTPQYYSDFSDVNVFVKDPFATCSYEAAQIDIGFTDTVRFYGSISVVPGPGVIGTPVANLQVDYWPDAAIDPNSFSNWVTGFLTARYIRSRVTMTPGLTPAILTAFTPTADRKVSTDGNVIGSPAVAAIGGTFIPFNIPFHYPPFVNPVPTTAGRTASATGVTTTGFTLQIFNGASDVGGSANWQAQGI